MACVADLGFSVVVFLLDDMRADQLPVLALTNARLADHAVVFDRAYVTVPMCCPERASFLSGGFLPQYTGVLTNEAPRGGATLFPDSMTLATTLQAAGYATTLNGKYLNEYNLMDLYVPPGWTRWSAVAEGDPWTDFDVSVGESTPDAPGIAVQMPVSGYVTDWQGGATSRFIEDHPDQPLFAYVSFRAPHAPHEPAIEDVGAFSGMLYRGGAWQEADVSDKPAWIQAIPMWTPEEVALRDIENEQRLETLLSVDRAIIEVLDTLEAEGRLESTIVVLTSDNGQQWGEHRLGEKGVGYEESVRMPLVIWNPAFAGRHTDALVATNLDLAATVTDVAGLPARGEGESLLPVVCAETDEARDFVPLQLWPYMDPPWAGVVTQRWKYIETATGETELYDLPADPTEAQSVSGVAENQIIMEELSEKLDSVRGLQITTTTVPEGSAGAPYSTALDAWGGEPPYHWAVVGGNLPAGLTLGQDGLVTGIPGAGGTELVSVVVTDAGISPFDGRAQSDQRKLLFVVRPNGSAKTKEECGCGDGAVAVAGLAALSGLAWRRRRQPPVQSSLDAVAPPLAQAVRTGRPELARDAP